MSLPGGALGIRPRDQSPKRCGSMSFRCLFPYKVVDMPANFMKEWQQRAADVSLKLSIRGMRNTWHREGIPNQSGCRNLLSLVAPSDSPELREAAMALAVHLVEALHDGGLTEPIDIDDAEFEAAEGDDDCDEKEVTMYGITTFIRDRPKRATAFRAPVVVPHSTQPGCAIINLGEVRFKRRLRTPSPRRAPVVVPALPAPKPGEGAGGVSPATAGGVSSASRGNKIDYTKRNLEITVREACALAEVVLPHLQKGDMNFATHLKQLAEDTLSDTTPFVEPSVEVALCVTTYKRTE